MKPRTLEELGEGLAADLAWRRKEILVVSGLLAKHSGDATEPALLRAATTMLYAHWEGYIKRAAVLYLGFVARRRLRFSELSSNFVSLWLRQQLSSFHNGRPFGELARATRQIRENTSTTCELSEEAAIRTRSNLNSEVLEEILLILGLDAAPFKTKEVLINTRLVKARNEIAHGQELYVKAEDFGELRDETLAMMERFRDQVENAAALKSYRAA